MARSKDLKCISSNLVFSPKYTHDFKIDVLFIPIRILIYAIRRIKSFTPLCSIQFDSSYLNGLVLTMAIASFHART